MITQTNSYVVLINDYWIAKSENVKIHLIKAYCQNGSNELFCGRCVVTVETLGM